MGYGLRKLDSERRGYGGRADRKIAADKVRRIRGRRRIAEELDLTYDDLWCDFEEDGEPLHMWCWRCDHASITSERNVRMLIWLVRERGSHWHWVW